MKPPSTFAFRVARRLPSRPSGLARVRPTSRPSPEDAFRAGLRQAAGRAYLKLLSQKGENR